MKRTFAAVMALALLLLAACSTPAVDLITPGDGVCVD